MLTSTLVVGDSDRLAVASPRDLIPNVNHAFLMARQIMPIGVDQGCLLCLAVDPADSEALAAMRFASGRDVRFIAGSPEEISRAFQTPSRSKAQRARLTSVPHALEVQWLRELLLDLVQQGGDELLVQRSGDAVLRRQGENIDSHSINPAQAEALIDAIDALIDADSTSEPGFDIAVGKIFRRTSVLSAGNDRRVLIPAR